MFKRHTTSNKELKRNSAYAIALAFPFVSLFGETKASKIISGENQLFVQDKYNQSYHFPHQVNNNKFNLKFNDFLIADEINKQEENTITEEKKVLISEVIIEGLEDHPEKERLETLAYDSMLIRPGSKVTSEEVKKDLDRIYSTGWFSGAKIESLESALGVQLFD